ncbi:MAG: hypothetical protein AB9846_05070 [Tenuifilaceae bacterium]
MENIDFGIDKKIRETLSKGTRIYRIIYGSIIFIIGFILIYKTGFSILQPSSFLAEALILTGIISIVYGIIGIELFKQRYRLKMDSESLRFKKSFDSEITIKLNKITHLKVLPMQLEISYDDYIKTYDFSWLTHEEFEKIKASLSNYCMKNKIDVE